MSCVNCGKSKKEFLTNKQYKEALIKELQDIEFMFNHLGFFGKKCIKCNKPATRAKRITEGVLQYDVMNRVALCEDCELNKEDYHLVLENMNYIEKHKSVEFDYEDLDVLVFLAGRIRIDRRSQDE